MTPGDLAAILANWNWLWLGLVLWPLFGYLGYYLGYGYMRWRWRRIRKGVDPTLLW